MDASPLALLLLGVLLFAYVLSRHDRECRALERAYTPKPRPLTRPEARGQT